MSHIGTAGIWADIPKNGECCSFGAAVLLGLGAKGGGGVSLAPLCLQGPVCIPCLEAQSCCQLERSPEERRKKNNTKIEKATKQALVVSVVTLLSFHC